MVGDRFRLRYSLTSEHYRDYTRLALRRARAGRTWHFMLGAIVVALLVMGLLQLFEKLEVIPSDKMPYTIIGMAVGLILMVLANGLQQSMILQGLVTKRGALIGEFSLAAYESGGIQISGKQMQSSYDWAAFIDLSQENNLVILWLNRSVGVIIPNSAFSSKEQNHEFVDFVRERIAAHRQTDHDIGADEEE